MSDTQPDYKSTIQLPQTAFPMKGNLPTLEPEMIKVWEDKKIYAKMVARHEGQKSFVLPDGPPYANGSIHSGHALNKTLKDIILKYKNMTGFSAPFIPGWDCHGLPIEHAVMKNLGPKAKTLNDTEIRELCRAEAAKWIAIQKDQFRRLGVLADWENPYLTMSPDYEAEEIREFARAYAAGSIYLGTKPVYWNWTLQTALADAEVEYHQHRSPSLYVKFPIQDAATLQKLGAPKGPTAFAVWTTTPWTLPANLGVCLNADFEYQVCQTDGENLIVAKGLRESVEKAIGRTLHPISEFLGRDLDRGLARHPFLPQDSLILLGSHVTLEAGTGCVHTAPGHGADDYRVGLQYGLPVYSPVGPNGTFTDEVPDFVGINIFKANPLIVEKLRQNNRVLAYSEFEHSYPHCWRSKTPLIFRATPQWFIGLDLPATQIRTKALKSLDQIQFFPSWGEARLRAMMENRPDWCLSRQRIWGVPIPIFYCKKTQKPLADLQVMMRVADAVEKEGGIDAFYKHSPQDFLQGYKPSPDMGPDFGSEGFVHGKDILDVWFDSGVCHAAVQRRRKGLKVPADLYLEGSDQHRGWFNTSLLSSMVTNGIPPFKALVTHGFVVDSQGLKMSKSKGNTVDPQEVAKRSGIEIMRLWCVYEDYGQDLSCGPTELERVTETYRRIRNTMRFLLGVTGDFDPAQHSVPVAKMTELDQWALTRLHDLVNRVQSAYESYEFYKVYHTLNQFFTVDLSATYCDILKDRLYTWRANGPERRSAQTVLFTMTDCLIRLMAPILSFLAEESYSYLKTDKRQESVFLLDFPVARPEWNNPQIAERFTSFLKLRTDVQKELELLRAQKTIGASLEAQVTIRASSELLQKLQAFAGLREFLIVSKVELALLTGATAGVDKVDYQVHAEKASGEKCVRCWTISEQLSSNPQFPAICPKCTQALSP